MESKKLVFKQKVSIAIPASLVSDIPHLREKTARIGMVGRACAIFGVEEIVVYPDLPKKRQIKEINLITTILSYMETPQYLRKRLFELRPELRYAGILPPLRTPHHPTASRVKDLADGDCRVGVITSHSKQGSLVDVGVEQPALLSNRRLPVNSRVSIRIIKTGKTLEARMAKRTEPKEYWGYHVFSSDVAFERFLKENVFDLVIAASRFGRPLNEVSKTLTRRWRTSQKVFIGFGAPARGLYEIVRREKLSLDNLADFVVNTIPNQKTETVRTEEALLVTLGVFNLLAAKG